MEEQMSVLARAHLLGKSRWLDCPLEPLPAQLEVLLCLLEGAERRQQLQAKLDDLSTVKQGQRQGGKKWAA
jgi:hypothetical protein